MRAGARPLLCGPYRALSWPLLAVSSPASYSRPPSTAKGASRHGPSAIGGRRIRGRFRAPGTSNDLEHRAARPPRPAWDNHTSQIRARGEPAGRSPRAYQPHTLSHAFATHPHTCGHDIHKPKELPAPNASARHDLHRPPTSRGTAELIFSPMSRCGVYAAGYSAPPPICGQGRSGREQGATTKGRALFDADERSSTNTCAYGRHLDHAICKDSGRPRRNSQRKVVGHRNPLR
jgi:hypothetical protein